MRNPASYATLKSLFMAILVLVLTAGMQTLRADEKPKFIVEPDNFPLEVDALNRAIETYGDNVIYVLRNGKTYFIEKTMEYDHFLQIEAEVYPSDNPPIIRPATDLVGTGRRISTFRNSIVMKGIFFYAMDDLGSLRQSQRTSVPDIHLHYKYCYFMGGENYTWWLGATGTTVRIEDSQAGNLGRHTSLVNQRFLDTRGLDTDSLIIINTSLYNVGHHIIRTVGSVVNYVYIDHMTVANAVQTTFDLHLTKEITIKNSLFQNVGVEGRWESAAVVGDAGQTFDGEPYVSRSGWIYITSYDTHFAADENGPRNSDRKIVIKNNNFGGLPSQEFLDNWALFNVYDPVNNPLNTGGRGSRPWGTDPAWTWANPGVTAETNPEAWAARDTIALTRVWSNPMDSLLRAWAREGAPWVTIENNIRENVTIPDIPSASSFANYVKANWYNTPDMPNHYDRWADISATPNSRYFHPGPGNPVATTGSTGAWFRNFAYNQDTPSFTHAENGYPVGSLVFFPELRAKWGDGEILSGVSVNETPVRQSIVAYPNPVRDVLYLSQEADEVMIYSILGKLVLRAQNVQSIDVGDLSNGIYIMSLVRENQVSTQKIMVNK